MFHDRFLADLRARIPGADVERFADAAHLVTLDAAGRPGGGPMAGRPGDRTAPGADRHRRHDGHGPAGRGSFTSVLASLGHRHQRHHRPPTTARTGPSPGPSSTPAPRSGPGRCRTPDSGRATGCRCSSPRAASCWWPPGRCGRPAGSRWWPTPRPASAGSGAWSGPPRPGSWSAPRPPWPSATALRFAPGATRLSVGRTPGRGSPGALPLEPEGSGAGTFTPVRLHAGDVAAIVHTSGATGPAKAVRYTHGALAAQRDVVGPLFGMRPGDAFTTSFGPFMLLAPSLQMTCVRPDFPVDRPSALGFDELHAATDPGDGDRGVALPRVGPPDRGHRRRPARPRSDWSCWPVPRSRPTWWSGVRAVTGGDVRAPWGMTECLPVTDGTEPEARGAARGELDRAAGARVHGARDPARRPGRPRWTTEGGASCWCTPRGCSTATTRPGRPTPTPGSSTTASATTARATSATSRAASSSTSGAAGT